MPSANVPYTPYSTVESSGSLGGGFGVRATPNNAGAQVAQAQEKAGAEGFDIAMKQQGMVNETLMTNADADFATKLGKLKGDYTTLTGQSAYNAFPKYQEDVKSAFQEARANLPSAAQRGFDMMATRTMANHIADGSSYASSQLKEANRDSYSSLANANLQALLDPQVAANKDRSDYHLDTLKFAAQAQVDEEHPGLKTDPETGTVSFDESTPEGRQGKANLQHKLDTYLSQGYVNRFDTLAKHDVFGAYDSYKEERDKMPKSAQVALDASFGPRIQDAHKNIASGDAINDAAHTHFDILTNPSKRISSAIFSQESGNQFGNQTSSSGAIGGAQIMPATFAQYAKPGENINNPQDNKVVGQRIIDDYTNRYNGDASRVAVAYFSGPGNVSPAGSPTPYIKDTMDSDGKHVSSYVSDVNGRLGEKPKTYATNENGAPMSIADYYRTHSLDVLARGDEYAERQMPGDLALKRAVRESLTNYMNKTISNEHQAYMLDNRNVMKAINGDLSNGKPPETGEELRALPGMGDILDRVATQDPKFSESIPTLISKAARRNDVTNSSNAYGTIQRVLEPHGQDHPNAISSQDHLDRLLARPEGTGINMKDYKDAKPALELDPTIKEKLSKQMQEISVANGNLDGKGQQRAVQWYNNFMDAYQKNEALGAKKDQNFADHIGEAQGPAYAPPTPSRITQMTNWVKEKTGTGSIVVRNPNGDLGTIPAGQVEEALKAGYRKVE